MKRVLITDDATFMRMSLKSMLEKCGFEIVGEAENGLVAIGEYKILKPDIITLDITMPIMDGLTALKNIKAFDKNAKVIMISAMGQESIVREAIISGAMGFVIKPFTQETIIKAFSKF
ncbi:response regulator [Clostridium estertheticum]|uniref:response regulator n=1 Tax=Clostridium estertheticum TaxID=238834 RepID=UPI001CF366CB|nr:response regulator [Clostridium estertheticum]MCB2308696.1 response regulator [Clostridium estertheticum]MCB2347495.1 response regulator [Clostridium estertheticum]MCB2351681.1 response regulator [Clostridium estertheticum]WAG45347.1 response regulator [Clostridium estertheticum]